MEMEFDVEDRGDGYTELIPEFFKAELPKQSIERDVYGWYLDMQQFEAGAILIGGPENKVLNPPERITLREFEERHSDEFGNTWCSHLPHPEW